MKKVLLTILIVMVIAILGIGTYVKVALPNVGAAPNLKIDATEQRIQHGAYLANHVSLCVDCHSIRDWTLYSGPMKSGSTGKGGEYFGKEAGFPGNFYSKNITPFHLKDWTDGEIFRAITTGVSKDGSALFPVMPYAYFGRMDKKDIYDIIAYIRTLQPIDNTPPARSISFPFNFILNTIPQKATFSTKPPKTDIVKYGAYMTNAAGCMECHTPEKNGQIIQSKAFMGGRKFDLPGITVYSANLTPDDATGIGSWSAEQFVARFKAYNDPANIAKVTNEHPNQTIMPWSMYAGMDSTDLVAIFKYLQTLKPINNRVEHFVAAASK